LPLQYRRKRWKTRGFRIEEGRNKPGNFSLDLPMIRDRRQQADSVLCTEPTKGSINLRPLFVPILEGFRPFLKNSLRFATVEVLEGLSKHSRGDRPT
jgi:hypothetical protein